MFNFLIYANAEKILVVAHFIYVIVSAVGSLSNSGRL